MDMLPGKTLHTNGHKAPSVPEISPQKLHTETQRRVAHEAQREARRFLVSQVTNSTRNVDALRPFRPDEFGSEPGCPSNAHIQAVNQLIVHLRSQLQDKVARLEITAQAAARDGYSSRSMEHMLRYREHVEAWVKLIEKIWAFYLELFGQRQTHYASMLLAADRIALDCYQVVYTGLGKARSIPSPSAFSYMETGFTPATFRRGVPLSRLGQQLNQFPIVSLPYHRLVNVWTLGAVHHEVSHNLQSDLDLWDEVPQRIRSALEASGINGEIAEIWSRWHKETWADLSGVLLGGPSIVASLMDVIGRSFRATTAFNPTGVHPTSFLRLLINIELLRRMGFGREAARFQHMWLRLYPDIERSSIPAPLMRHAKQSIEVVVDTIAYQPYAQLGNKSLAAVAAFRTDHQAMIGEAAQRLAIGIDPGIIPARFLVAAARQAFDQQLAPPQIINDNFYRALRQR